MKFKEKLEDYPQEEFLRLLESFFNVGPVLKGEELSKHDDTFVAHFEAVTEHPYRSGVIFYPKEGQEDSPEGILAEVKRYRAEAGKPGFKPE